MSRTAMAGVSRGAKRTVLITGVTKGLGRALALEMAKLGHCVIGCARSQDTLNSLQTLLPNSPDDSSHLLLNVDVVLFFVIIHGFFGAFYNFVICDVK